jgi:hypothetical protein
MIRRKLFENFAHPRGDEAGELLQKQFADAGLAAVETRTMRFDPPAVMVIGHRS